LLINMVILSFATPGLFFQAADQLIDFAF